jgi:hypothetical protein
LEIEKNKEGAVYIAFGYLYLVMALFSMRTLKKRNITLPVMIITNIDFDFKKLEFWSEAIDSIQLVNLDPRENRQIKTDLYKFVPFNRVAFIDADTYILNDIKNAWKFLDYFDLALRVNPTKQKKIGKGDQLVIDSNTYVRDVTHFNSGVIFFKKSENTKNFFSLWTKYFKERNSPYDQISLVDAIFKSEAKVLPLIEDWNYFPDLRYYIGKVEPPYIVHYTNRISYLLETEFIKIAKLLGFEVDELRNQIKLKRLTRKKKIGLFNWFKMLFCWRFLSNFEKKNW